MKNKILKIYIDGASRGNPGKGSCAAIIMDENNNIISEEARYLGQCTNNFAEYSALHLALTVSERLKGEKLEIFSDSELLVKQFNGEYAIKNEKLVEMMKTIKKLVKNFKEIKISHIKRNLNKIADKLANDMLDSKKLTKKENLQVAKEVNQRLNQEELF